MPTHTANRYELLRIRFAWRSRPYIGSHQRGAGDIANLLVCTGTSNRVVEYPTLDSMTLLYIDPDARSVCAEGILNGRTHLRESCTVLMLLLRTFKMGLSAQEPERRAFGESLHNQQLVESS